MRRILAGLVLVMAFVQQPTIAQEVPRIDVAFLLDATGSMGDEIDAVKEKIQDMISNIALGDPQPDVRFGIVAYRDRGDDYVTVTYELTRDIDEIIANLEQIRADGGGDYPESLSEALHGVVNELNWDMGAGVSRLVFLIADAPPHLDYPGDYDYREEYQMALEKGIAVHAIGASGLDEEGERIFEEIAGGTGGTFQWLAYESRYVDQDGEEVIVVVEGRSATYTRGDSSWTVEGGDAVGMAVGLGGGEVKRGGIEGGPEFSEEMALDATGAGPGAPAAGAAASVETSTNLDDLITSAIKDAAEEAGVDYKGDKETAVRSVSWGEVKKLELER